MLILSFLAYYHKYKHYNIIRLVKKHPHLLLNYSYKKEAYNNTYLAAVVVETAVLAILHLHTGHHQ